MSMVLELRRVSPDVAGTLVADPDEAMWFLTGVDASPPDPGFVARLFGAKPPPASPSRTWVEPDASTVAYLDKAWHAIHFLLAGDAGAGDLPAGYLVHGGQELGEVDLGYGPVRVLTPMQTREFADHVERIGESELEERYDPEALQAADVYPGSWGRDGDEFQYLWGHFERLQSFLREAREEGQALLVYLS